MVLRRVHVPLAASVNALGRHIAHLQEDQGWVLLITTRMPAEVLTKQLHGIDWNRLVFIDTVAPVHTPPPPGARIEYVPGTHLLELVHLRAQRIMARLPRTPHVVYYDAHSLSSAVPREALAEMTREWALVSPVETWTDIVIHDQPVLPTWQQALYAELIPHVCLDCPARMETLQASL